jgi:hypothetical protein
VPLEGHPGIRLRHAFPVIYYLYKRFSRILDEEPDIGSA